MSFSSAVMAGGALAFFLRAFTCKQQRRQGRQSQQQARAVLTPPVPMLAGGLEALFDHLSPSAQLEVLRPGLVLIKGALSPAAQLALARAMLTVGHGQRRWWKTNSKSGQWELTGQRQGRGRVYDAVGTYYCLLPAYHIHFGIISL